MNALYHKIMILRELLNLLEEENFPEATPSNVDEKFKVGKVNFDNKNGMGATPMGQNILYRGAVAWIKPTTFKALATAADRTEDAKNFAEMMKRGKPIAAPFLILSITREEDDSIKSVKVVSHEGRARTDAILLMNGNDPIPVQLFLSSGERARHLSPEFFEWIEDNGIRSEDSNTRVFPDAKFYFWNGEKIFA